MTAATEVAELTATAHPDAMKALRVQAMVLLTSAVLSIAIVLLVLFLSARPLTKLDAVWMSAATVLAIGCVMGGRWSLAKTVPSLRMQGNTLYAGDASVPVDARTTIELAKGALVMPKRAGVALFRLPGFTGFPHFDGGPTLRVRTGDKSVELQPLLYGPAGFFGAAADANTTALVRKLVETSSRGDISPWLRDIFAPSPIPKVNTSVTAFLVSYIVVTVLIFGFLGYLFLFGLQHNVGR